MSGAASAATNAKAKGGRGETIDLCDSSDDGNSDEERGLNSIDGVPYSSSSSDGDSGSDNTRTYPPAENGASSVRAGQNSTKRGRGEDGKENVAASNGGGSSSSSSSSSPSPASLRVNRSTGNAAASKRARIDTDIGGGRHRRGRVNLDDHDDDDSDDDSLPPPSVFALSARRGPADAAPDEKKCSGRGFTGTAWNSATTTTTRAPSAGGEVAADDSGGGGVIELLGTSSEDDSSSDSDDLDRKPRANKPSPANVQNKLSNNKPTTANSGRFKSQSRHGHIGSSTSTRTSGARNSANDSDDGSMSSLDSTDRKPKASLPTTGKSRSGPLRSSNGRGPIAGNSNDNDDDADDASESDDDSASLMDRKPRAKPNGPIRSSSKTFPKSSSSAIILLSDSEDEDEDEKDEPHGKGPMPLEPAASQSKKDSASMTSARGGGKATKVGSNARGGDPDPSATTTPFKEDYSSSSDLEIPCFRPLNGDTVDRNASRATTSTATPRGRSASSLSTGAGQSSSNDFRNLVASPSDRKIPTPAIPTLSPRTLNRIGGRLYPDLRHAFIKRLLAYARDNRRASHQKVVFDTSVRAIVVLSLRLHPIRSAEATKQINGIGSELMTVLKDAATTDCRGSTPHAPRQGKFSAVAPAAVVAAFEYETENPDQPLCSMEELIRRTNVLMDPQAGASLGRSVDYYLSKENVDPGWCQVQKLCSENVRAGLLQLLKERRKKKLCTSGVVFELTDDGRAAARRLKRALREGPVEPGPLRQLASDTVREEFGNVTMSMDFREGGGGSHSLHKMCDYLDIHGVPYVVRNLKISDYLFFVGNKLAPILIERKSADDVAMSLADGRWERQQRNMRMAQFVLGGGAARRCQICYLIEGDASRRTVHGGNVGRASWNQSLEDVENAISDLPRLGFSVVRSKSHRDTIMKLSQIAKDVAWKAKNRSIDATMTYEDFTSRIRNVDGKEGDPPTLREHQYPAAPIVDPTTAHLESAPAAAAAASRRSEVESPTVPNGTNDSPLAAAGDPAVVSDEEAALKKLSVSDLKERCKDRDEKITGTKAELISRLLKPRKPEILIVRARRGDYVPKVPSCNAALMVGLLINTREGEGLTKEELMGFAEESGVSKEPMDAKNGWYDGWAGMKDLKKGDPALVCMKKKRFCLTTQPQDCSGRKVARALHILAHRQGICRCGNHLVA